MNKQIITTLVAVLFSVATAFAAPVEPTIIPSGKSFTIDAKVWKSELVDVMIIDAEGTILYTDVQAIKTVRKYSMDNLPNGNYKVIVSNELKTIVNEIAIDGNSMSVDYGAAVVYKPSFKITDSALDINYLTNSDANVIIYKGTDLVFSSEIKGVRAINKRFNIDALPAGNYLVVLETKEAAFSQSFSK